MSKSDLDADKESGGGLGVPKVSPYFPLNLGGEAIPLEVEKELEEAIA